MGDEEEERKRRRWELYCKIQNDLNWRRSLLKWEKKQAEERLERELRIQETIKAVSKDLLRGTAVGCMIDPVTKKAKLVSGANAASIFFPNGDAYHLSLATRHHDDAGFKAEPPKHIYLPLIRYYRQKEENG